MSLSCPEVAKLFINEKEKMTFAMEEEILSNLDFNNMHEMQIDEIIYDFFWKVRSFFIEIAQFREIELWKRILLIKYCQEKFQILINSGKYNHVDSLIEALNESITDEKIYKFIRANKTSS